MNDRYEIQLCSMGDWYNMRADNRTYATSGEAMKVVRREFNPPEEWIWRVVNVRTGDVVERGAERKEGSK